MENIEIAALLSETADLMEIAGEDPFRIRSFRNGATVIETFPERVAGMVADPERDVTVIPGIGKGLAAVLKEIVARGSFERRDLMLQKYPPTALELLKIQGLGPKSIALLFEHYRVSSVDDLERICREGKLRLLPRMGEKLEQKVLRSIESYRRSASRYLLDHADRVAAELSAYLAQTPGVERVTPAGSLRRGRETVGDVDLLVTGPDPGAVLERFLAFPKVREVLARGGNKTSAKIGHEAIQVDVRVLEPGSFGSAMQYFTGSKGHNVALRNRAIQMGLKLSEYGLFRTSDDVKVGGETEEEIYLKLNLKWIPPELRENGGEIEAAAEDRLPELVELEQIRGDLHAHTVETDGRNTIAELVEAARAMGYQYLAITDHSKALAMANGLDEKRLVAQIQQVRRAAAELDFPILAGCECDIRQDGRMDLDDEALAQLDVVVGSIHSFLNMEPAAMTDRLLRALENRYLQILGHPTGRLLLRREGFGFDFERVAGEAARRNIHFEINASPERLDLSSAMVRAAQAQGAKFVISTDAHHLRHLENMKYGVQTARRGWLGPEDVLNTREVEGLRAALRRGKR